MKNIDIIIRPLRLKDINNKYISWFADVKVTKYLDARNISVQDSKNYLKTGILNRTYYIYAICDSNTHEHIGNIKIGPLRRFDGVSDLVTVIGNRKYWGKGLATKAIKLLISKAFNEGGIRKFSASIDSNNKGSVTAYQRAGFKEEAKLHNYFYKKYNNKIILSDKIYVFYDNLKFDLDKLKNWEPIIMSDIL